MLTALLAFAADLRYGARSLLRSRLFSVAAVVSLGLSIGGTSAMFSLFDTVLWQPMAVEHGDSVVKLFSLVSGRPAPGPLSYPDYRDYANARVAVIGLYAVMAYSVGRRTREIGIRVAIGAAPSGILRLVLREGIVLTAAGMTIGLMLAFALTRMVSAILTGVSPTDPLVFTAVPALLLVVAFLACCAPARRALGVDPVHALRQE